MQDDGDLHVVFIPQVTASDADDDRIAIESIITRLPERARDRIRVAEPAVSVEEAVAQFASCDALVASRLHASLLALATGVPSLVIAYEAKVAGVLAELGLEDRALPVEETWQAVDLVSRLRSLWDPEERARSITALARARTGFGAFQDTLERALRK